MEKYALGVDLGGTSVKIGLVDNKGKILQKGAVPTKAEEGPERVIKQIKKGINEILDKSDRKIEGIGIGSPGAVNTKKGTIEYPPNLPGWKSVALGKILKKEYGTEVYLENDANAAAIGEMIFGAGKSYDNFIMVTLGTGVGGGIIINRKIYRGETGGAGELGHLSIDYKGHKCKCGSYGCIETYAGNGYLVGHTVDKLEVNQDSLVVKLIEEDISKLTPKIIDEAAEKGDKFALEVVRELGENLGFAFASVVNLFDISKIIVGGGVAGFGKKLFVEIERSIKSRVLKPFAPRVKVLPARLKNNAGIKGASALVFYH